MEDDEVWGWWEPSEMEDDGVLEMVGPHWDGGGWGLWWWISTGMEDNGILGDGNVLGGRSMGFGDGGISVGSQWEKG